MLDARLKLFKANHFTLKAFNKKIYKITTMGLRAVNKLVVVVKSGSWLQKYLYTNVLYQFTYIITSYNKILIF